MGGSFFFAMQDGLRILATETEGKPGESPRKKLTLDALRILLYLMGRMEYDNHIRLTQRDVALEMGIHKSRVSRAMRLLLARDIVCVGERAGRSTFYRLNPAFGWRGEVQKMPTVAEWNADVRRDRERAQRDRRRAEERGLVDAAPSPLPAETRDPAGVA